MAYELEKLLAKKFISRQNPMAQQMTSISYQPVHRAWTRADLTDHLSGAKTYGHYLVSEQSECKLFCLDVDIKQGEGYLPTLPIDYKDNTADKATEEWERSFQKRNLRKSWLDRKDQSRGWTKFQLRMIAGKAAQLIWDELAIPVAVASSGSKGVHIYGFTGLVPAADAREAGLLVLELMTEWKLSKGNSTFDCSNTDPMTGFPNFDIEVYPKQETLGEGQLGNLLRLPMGVNKKAPKNPTFFLDLRAPMGEWRERPWNEALSDQNPWG